MEKWGNGPRRYPISPLPHFSVTPFPHYHIPPLPHSPITTFRYLYPSPLGWPAPVVRNRRHVADRFHFETDCLQGADRRFAPRARTLHADVERAHAHGLCGVAGVQRRLRGSKRRPLAGTLEA